MKYNSIYLLLSLLCCSSLWTAKSLHAQQSDNEKILWTANWSHDGKFIAVGGDDGALCIFNGNSFELINKYPIGSGIKRVRWHPKKNLLAIAADSDGSCIINIENKEIIKLKGAESNGGRAIEWNKRGNLLAAADYEGNITIWKKDGTRIKTIKKKATKSYVAIDWHPKKNQIIALSEFIRIYDTKGNLLRKIDHRKERVLMLCVEWHKSGKFFVIGDYGDYDHDYKPVLQFWSADGTLKKEIKKSKAEYRNISWTKDGQRLASASDRLRIWSKEGDLLAEGPAHDLLWGVDWSPDSKYIISSSIEGHIKIWSSEAKLIKELPRN